ncbi:MAG TPA: endopeptidase La [Termitinemataceae bacterium]|nr:endopeptidase La [Termitinemataceae bacterium]HOM22779.1 endopeptidase La [Termitinemataceae bacterium]HPQ00689.1 endopeptidase La [Termitinemataceae bacterium]
MKIFSLHPEGRITEKLPILLVDDFVLFPDTVVSIVVSTPKGIKAIDEAIVYNGNRIFAACKSAFGCRDPFDTENPRYGTVAYIQRHMSHTDISYRVVLQGEYRAEVIKRSKKNNLPYVTVRSLIENPYYPPPEEPELVALLRSIQQSFSQYAEVSKKVNQEVLSDVLRIENLEKVCNLVSHTLPLKTERKLELLAQEDLKARAQQVYETIERETEVASLQKSIASKVKSRMDKTQREYILNEQLKEIRKELGKDEAEEDEFDEIEKNLNARGLPEEVLAKAKKELRRLKRLQAMSPEAGVLRGYIEWILDLPWKEQTTDNPDLERAETILNEDHYNMKKAKERILEYLAVRKLTDATRGPILCFVGPPGTGKTSLGRSVARALGRTFVRVSLGGVRDEAEIRGHRKTYVGALPGKILQSMKKAATINPVFLLDEIDKLSSDFRGDPAAALLEVLDPEQNNAFVDHYLEVPYNLSKVLFIATANSLHTIPHPLLDRMEVIEVPGYGENEKLQIAKQYLIPKQLAENGLGEAHITFQDEAILDIIRYRTMESGVRNLEREIAHCSRKLAREALAKGYGTEEKPIGSFSRTIRVSTLSKLLGNRKYKHDLVYTESRIGVCYGLAWTETGGTMLPVETVRFEGSGELIITGNLGDVMKESARIALSFLRSMGQELNVPYENFTKYDFHIHVPEGAIPKDGPSAGITLASSLLSCLLQRAPRSLVAMTGELTLTGRVLPIGGLKEKLLAALRNGITNVILPQGNKEDLEELDKDIIRALSIHYVEKAPEVFAFLFPQEETPTTPLSPESSISH